METVSKHKHDSNDLKQAARCTGSTKEQNTQRTAGYGADGFLNHRFLPLYRQTGELPDKAKVEKGFFQSLAILKKTYSCELKEYKDKPYPYNILLAHREASLQLNAQGYPIRLSIVENEDSTVCISATQAYDTGSTLYYIPAIPLYRLLKDKARKRSGELMLSIFTYLYHVAGVPYYRDSYSALDYYYEMMKEWLMEDAGSYDETEWNANISEFYAAAYYGDVVFRKLFNRCHLQQFQQRIAQFIPQDSFDKECLALAKDYYELYTLYPDRSIADNIPEPKEDDYDNELIRLEQYVSFVAATKGWLYENIEQSVNNEFNEYGSMEEPVITQVFNDATSSRNTKNLAYEYRLFDLIGDLCSLLNDLP